MCITETGGKLLRITEAGGGLLRITEAGCELLRTTEARGGLKAWAKVDLETGIVLCSGGLGCCQRGERELNE